MSTKDYAAKRRFEETPEPQPATEGNVDVATARPGERFVIHQHHATRLHFDLRLEMFNGEVPVLVSWAVPKNLPLRRKEAHLAVHVEDHPIDYGDFSGTIPAGNYGAGEVRIFDRGTYEVLEQEPNKLTFRLRGDRLTGEWHMIVPKPEENTKDWLVFLRSDDRPERDPLPAPEPMMATLVRDPFDDDNFLFEPKWDGVRALAICTDSTLLLSRNKHDISATYPELERLHERLVAVEAILDGEVVAFDGERPSFERLQSRINLQDRKQIERSMKDLPVSYVAFDLLYLDGRDLTHRPVEERRELLEQIVVPTRKVQVSPAVVGDGIALSDVARARHLEGIVAKKLGSPYRPGKRTREWLKVKVTHDADVVIGGWSPGEGTRSSWFGSLLAGVYEGEDLHFIGAIGTGFSEKMLGELMPYLKECEADEPPFVEDPTTLAPSRFGKALRSARWTHPVMVATVEFRELTSGSRLRAPSFKGLRRDKDPQECTLEALHEAAGM